MKPSLSSLGRKPGAGTSTEIIRFSTPAFQQRLEKIIESNRKIPKNWKMKLPDFDSHLDEIGFIEEEEETELSSFEEE